MQRRYALALLLACVVHAEAGPSDSSSLAAERYGRPGPLAVTTITLDWFDTARAREVPAKIYLPQSATGRFPVIVFSHGLGGSREGYAYLARYWASHGYLCAHLTHLGSDSGVLQQGDHPFAAMSEAALDPRNAIDRPRDVSFAIDQLTALGQTNELFKGRIALDRIGVAGHSFGGYTALAIAGQRLTASGSGEGRLADPRVKAVIALSAPARSRGNVTLDRMYGSIRIPCFLMTGTKDDSPIGETKAAARRIPFDHLRVADACLLTLQGGDHMVFAGPLRGLRGGAQDDRFRELILLSSTAFWEAYLRGVTDARAWLVGEGCRRAIGREGVLEVKMNVELPRRNLNR